MKTKYTLIVCIMLLLTTIPAVANIPNTQPQELSTDEWAMFRHDPHHSGNSISNAPNTNTTYWMHTLGTTLESSPAYSNGRVYIGSKDAKLYCLNASNGMHLWNYTTLGMIGYSSPAVYNDKVYAASAELPWQGTIYCLDALLGDELWTYTTGSAIYSSPTLSEGKLYIGSHDKKIYCLDADTGEHIWNYTTAERVTSSPAISNGKLYVGSLDGKLYCLDAFDGKYLWNYTTKDSISYSSPTVIQEKVFFGSFDNKTYCIDANSGIELWNFTTKGFVLSSPAVYNDKLYIGSYDYTVYCLNMNTGTLIWNYTTDGRIFSSPAVADGKIYVGSRDKKLYCFHADTGDIVWTYTTGAGIGSSPAVGQGAIYIASTDGIVYSFRGENQPPETPTIQGPAAAGPGIPLDFEVVAEDLDNDQILYMIDWGDGNSTDWLGPYNSSEPIIVTNTWIEKGDYTIRTKAKDVTSEEESEWSEPHMISIAPQLDLSNIKSGFVYLRYKTFNKSYAYLYFLDTIGASIVISSDVLHIEVDASDAVKSVQYTAYSPLWDDNLTINDTSSEDGFIQDLEIPMGLWVLTVTAFDADGRMIDVYSIDYLVFITITSSETQQLRQTNTMIKQRINNHLLHR